MKKLQLSFSSGESEVFVGHSCFFQALEEVFQKAKISSAILVLGQGIANFNPAYLKTIFSQSSFQIPTLVLEDKEEDKNFNTVQKLYEQLYQKVNRHTAIIALGGGVLGDMVGFASATFLRGLPFILVPTTLLSQVDASLGGKNGVNFQAAKNAIGTVRQPLATIIDTAFLESLSERDVKSGYVEMLKHGLIQDAKYWAKLTKIHPNQLAKLHPPDWVELIFRSLEIKAEVVQKDEQEKDLRAILNLGHTLGHYLEAKTNYNLYRHGECVLVGMDFALYFSYRQKKLPLKDWEEAHTFFQKFQLSFLGLEIEKEDFVQKIGLDKKMFDSGLNFIGIDQIGHAFIQKGTAVEDLFSVLEEYRRIPTSFLPEKAN